MKTILLTRGQRAIVDDADFDWLNQWKWYAHWDRYTKSFYAERIARLPNGKRRVLSMHRLILGLGYGDTRQGDHVNHDTLDQRRSNLRIVTNQENQFNQRDAKGYSWNRAAKKFMARIQVNGKLKYLGLYDLASDAKAAYLKAKSELHHIREYSPSGRPLRETTRPLLY